MSLMKCPECGKEVSSSTISCPNCGFDVKHRHWYSKKWGHYLILIVIILISLCCYKFYSNTKGLVKTINEETQNEYIVDIKLDGIKSKYNELSFIEKMFVYNYSKTKNIPVKITGDNIKKYINLNITFKNYKYEESKSFLGIKKYTETSDIDVQISSHGKYEFKDIEFKINMNNGYKVKYDEEEDHLNIKLDKNGSYQYSGEVINKSILNNSLISNLKKPSFDINNAKIKDLTGYIIYK